MLNLRQLMLHHRCSYLNKMVTAAGASGAIMRLLLDQFLFSLIFIGVFLSTLLNLEGRPSQVPTKLQQEWLSAVIANWQLWIPFQFLIQPVTVRLYFSPPSTPKNGTNSYYKTITFYLAQSLTLLIRIRTRLLEAHDWVT